MGDLKELVPADQRKMVAALEGLLSDVESGEVVGFAYVALRKGQDPLHGYVGPDEKTNVHELVSSLEGMKFRILNHQYGCGDGGGR